jgi:phage-related tail protein
MQDTKTTTFGGKKITIVELTTAQIRTIFDQIEKQEPQLLDDLINESVPVIAIAEASGISMEDLEQHKPSKVSALAKEVAAINPFLADMIKRRVSAFEKLATEISRQQSTGTPAS